MKTWGRSISYSKTKKLSENDEVLHNEYYLLEGSKTNFEFAGGLDKSATEEKLIQEAVKEFAGKPELSLIYAEVSVTDGGMPGFFYDVKTKYIIKGNHPFPASLAIAIAIAVVIFIIGLTIAITMWHVVESFLGGNLWAFLLIFMVLVVALILGYDLYKGRQKKGIMLRRGRRSKLIEL